MDRFRKIIMRLAFWTISIFLAVLIGEIGVRSLKLSKSWLNNKEVKVMSELRNPDYEPEYFPNYKPNMTARSARGKTIKTNNLGFRDNDINEKKPAGKIRIGFLGDSVIEGFGVENKERATDLVSAKLHEQFGGKFEVMNFGIAGFNTIDENYVLQNYVLPLEPDHIILQFSFNDIETNTLREMRLKEHQVKSGAGSQANIAQEAEGRRAGKKKGFKVFLQKYSALYLFIAEIYNGYKLRKNQENTLLSAVLNTGDEDWNATERALRELKAVCESNALPLAVIYVPQDCEVIVREKQKGEVIIARLRKICTSLGIPVIETFESFRAQEDKLYIDDCHLNLKGNKMLAEKIATYLTGYYTSP
jgi:lysophospholipase L1-like esterase